MSVGFGEEDFTDNETWQDALRRGPLTPTHKCVTDTATQTEDPQTPDTIDLCSEESDVGVADLFLEEEDEDYPLTVSIENDESFDQYMDIGTPTLHGTTYDPRDFMINTTLEDIFTDDEDEELLIDMNNMGVCGINLGLLMDRSSPVSRFIFRPLDPLGFYI
jgi:hypothetical protein